MPKNVVNRDSAIKRFELTFELAWKAIKAYSAVKGVLCRLPRDCFQEAFKTGIVMDNPLWLKMIEDRNLTIHTYNEQLAEDIYGRLKDYLPLFQTLGEALK